MATRSDGAGMTHALAFRGAGTGNEANHRFGDVRSNELGGFFLGAAADFTDHDDAQGLRIGLEQLQAIDEVHALHGVAADTDAGRLAKGRASEEAAKIIAAAKAEAEQEIVKAREALRDQVAVLAVKGAEQILRKEVNATVHGELLGRLKAEL